MRESTDVRKFPRSELPGVLVSMVVTALLLSPMLLGAEASPTERSDWARTRGLRVSASTRRWSGQTFETTWTFSNTRNRAIRIRSCHAYVEHELAYNISDDTYIYNVTVKAHRTVQYRVRWRSSTLYYGGGNLITRVTPCRLRL